MRYDADVSIQQVNSDSSVALAAVDDRDSVGAGSSGPATGNLITDVEGDGGRDSVGASAVTVTRVASLNGGSSDDSGEDGSLQVNGQFGTLTVNIDGSYSYTRNADSPCGVEEIFAYTITDADGNESIARLIIRIEPSTLETRCLAEVARIVPGPDGIIVLPPGVDLEDVQVQGRDLVITMPDGTQWVIVDGAVFVPQLVINNIQIPPSNLTALLIGREVQPAAGPPQSSGGNFEVDPGNLDPGFELGDLLPPTELVFTPPTFGEVYQPLPQDEPPEVIIVTPDNPVGAVNATDEVDEAGLPARGTEPAGSQSATSVETTTGTIVIVSGDQPVTTTISGVSINGVAVTAIGQTFVTPLGTLTVTSISPTQIGYSYTLTDNTSGDSTHDDFSVQITDADGDTASATLRIDIIDDVPTARNDTDVVTASEAGTDGNVFTGAGTTSLAAGADTPGADNAVVSGFRAGSTGGFTAVGTGTTIVGQYGTLVVNANGSYVYTRDPGSPGGVTDVFTYELTDGDGDTSTARLDISIVDSAPVTGQNAVALLDDDALAGGNPGGVGDDPDAAALTGTLSASGGDGGLTFAFATSGAPTGFTYENQGDDLLVRQDGRLVLTITLDASTGAYTVVQNAPIAHSAGGDENNQGFSLTYTATDADGDAASGVLQIDVDDDTPDAPSVTLASTEPIAVTYEGALSGGNFVGPEESADSNVSPLVSQVDFSQGFVLGNLADYGADGPGATVVAYTLNFAAGFAEGGLSGLSSSGQPVYLYQGAGGVVIGSTATAEGDISGANTVFTIAVDAETGVLTVTQSQPVDHGDSDAYDGAYQDDLTSFGANILELEVSAYTTDSDGDRSATARGVIDLAGNIRFGDDGPTVDVTVTEEDPVLLVTQDAETIGDASDSASTTVDFAGVFARTFTSGADSPASAVWSYALAITGAADEAGLVDSGLDAGPTGANIYLYQLADGTIVGSTATTAPATIDDTVVFSIGVSDAGAVTLTQYSEIYHELEAGANDAPFDDQLAILDSGLVQLIGSSTVTDSDGDTATDSAFIDLGGNIRFADDGPVSSTGTYAVGEVHEDALANAAATGNLEAGETQVVTATVSAASLAAL
ncbi:MAG TPA: DUF5801 repeats-in-toxin domain-containing protein, partial [Allosphingosinicella sp.]|nr:DUF5801 repeats-in-toxin domain-containing protein [Allosphingosinicella sp.]